MTPFNRRWDEARRRWRGRIQRYQGDPLGAAGMLRRRFATSIAGVDTGASVSIEYSLPVLQNAPWLVERVQVDGTEFVACPDDCPVTPPLSHVYEARSNYTLRDVVVDTRTGFSYVQHLGRSTLVRESTSWPASQALWSVSRPVGGSAIETPLTVLSSPPNYFHFMTEDFPALLRVLEMWPDLAVGVRRGPRPRFVNDALRAIGKVPLELDRTIRAETLHLAGRGPDLGYLRSLDRQRLLDHLLQAPKSVASLPLATAPRVIYASRGTATRTGHTEHGALHIASDAGAWVVDFAEHGLLDQARLCHRANTIMGSHGAALTNSMFCHPGTTLIEIVNPEYHNRCFEWLAHTSGLKYYPVYEATELKILVERSHDQPQAR